MPLWDDDTIEQTNRLLGLVASEAGLQSAFAYLLSTLRSFLPVDLILCSLGTPGHDLIELARVCRELDAPEPAGEPIIPMYTLRVLTSAGKDMGPGPDDRARMRKAPGGQDGQTAGLFADSVFLLEHDPRGGTTMLGLRHAEYHSMLVLPAPREDDGPSLTVTLMSMTPGAFSSDHVPPCLAMTADLRRVLAGLFSLPQREKRSRRCVRQASPVELLRMCRGLTGVSRLVEKVAPLDAAVLITGETGVGKEIVAEAVHELSPRRSRPFLKLNCGAIPETLIESTLFGHEKGAFTGAVGTRPGYFEQADGGTLFLDEVGELSPLAQVRLLRALDRGEIQRVGGVHSVPVDVRVLAATNRDLHQMVRDGLFREDLLFRLSVFPIAVPPLRERRADIPILARRFLERRSHAMGLDNLPEIPDVELSSLYAYDWPGNVRELEHRLEQALILAKTGASASPLSFALPDGPARSPVPASLPTREPPLTLDELNRLYIEHILEKTGHVISGERGAARLLGLHPNTLRSRMIQLGIPSRGVRGRRKGSGRGPAPEKAD